MYLCIHIFIYPLILSSIEFTVGKIVIYNLPSIDLSSVK